MEKKGKGVVSKDKIQGDAISLEQILSLELTMLAKKKKVAQENLRKLPGLEFISHLKGWHTTGHCTWAVLQIHMAEEREST